MDNRTLETKARITAQKSLKDAAAYRLDIGRQIIRDTPNIWKGNRGAVSRKLEAYFDKYTERRLILRYSVKDKRNSKHQNITWAYLGYDPDMPFHHFENHLFPIVGIFLSSRKPQEYQQYELPIYLSRHCLERVFERQGTQDLSSSLKTLAEFIYILDSPEDNNWLRFYQSGKCVLISQNAYVVVGFSKENEKKSFNGEYAESYFIIESYLPHNFWSKKKQQLITPVLTNITNLTNKMGAPIAVINAEHFNSNNEITLEQCKYIY